MAPPPSIPPAMAKATTPKSLSSRLMTMKFMQRGVAQAAADAASSPSTPKTDDESSASKRRKSSHKSSTPATPNTPLYDQQAIQNALEEEEKKRLAAVEKRAAELGDSHWVLDGASTAPLKNGSRLPLNVVQVGFAQIDDAGSVNSPSGGDNLTSARTQFNMKSSKAQKKKNEDDESGSDDSEASGEGSEDGEVASDDEDDNRGRGRADNTTPGSKRARSSLSARREQERKKAQELAGKRRQKEIKLNKLTSISGGSGAQKQSPKFTCHTCGKPDHKMADCPKKR